jgi:hypothetical protein
MLSNCVGKWTCRITRMRLDSVRRIRNGLLLGMCLFLISYSSWAQSQREYIYMDGRLVAVESQQLTCSYALNPTSTTQPAAGGTGSFTVNTPVGCLWSASTTSAWITITDGGSGNGNGIVSYSAAANSLGDRTGAIAVGGQTHTVSQASYPQPTCLTFSPTIGFAGIDQSSLQFCNAANMTIKVRYNFTVWPGGSGNTQNNLEDIAGTTNGSGWINRNPLPQNTTAGTSVVTAIKNNLRSDWYQLTSPQPQFITRPAKPKKPNDLLINDSKSYTVILPGSSTEYSDNMQNQTVYAKYHMTLPNAGSDLYFSFPMADNAKKSYDHPCSVGNTSYLFTNVRNQLDTYDANAWSNDVNAAITYTRGSTCPDFTVSRSPATQIVPQPGAAVSFSVTVSPTNGFNVPVTLSVTGLPSGATGSFSPNPVSPNQASTLTISTPSYLGVGTQNFTIVASIQGVNGYLTHSTTASITLPAQPTCFAFSPTVGFAGIDPSNVFLCNAANMTIAVQYNFVPWTGGFSQGTDILGTTDASGWVYRSLPQNTTPGTSTITYYRNVLRSDWVYASTNPQFTTRPPKPINLWMTPTTLQLPGSRTLYVPNEENNQTIVLESHSPNQPPGVFDQYPLSMDWMAYWNSYVPCGVLPGTYTFTRVRNQLDSASDAWLALSGKTQTILACQ